MSVFRTGLIGLALLMLTACGENFKNIGQQSDPTRFYALTPTAVRPEQPLSRHAAQLVVGVGPVQVADYLDRSHIVTRESATELKLPEFDRWGGDLKKEIARVVSSNLATLLGTSGVVQHPWKSGVSPDVSVEISIERFERDIDGKVKLTAAWQIYADDGRTALLFRRTELEKESGAGFEAITQNLSELTGELSREIATAIAHIQPAAGR